jgi:hypothetical protein
MPTEFRSGPWRCVALLLTVVGCGPVDVPRALTVPVTGKVLYRGKPLTGGNIHFLPESGQPATGEIRADGTYRLSTFKKGDGAVPGHHRVAVVSGNAGPTVMPGSPGYKKPRALVPGKYGAPETSGLEADVGKKGAEVNFDLP